jgi:predicted regulator of Ras-like GTPase activity (Roadblock/LC7/MglB family)
MISIPLASLENGMKTGRVVIAWGEILGWLNPPASVPSVQGEVELELPLNVIAPLFIAKRRAAAAQTKVTVGEHIPDLFAGVAKPAPAPAPVVPPPAPAPVPARAPELSALGRLFGQPTKLEWSPQEIARQITALPGVTGSLLATTDGLLVAGQISPPLTGETLAAFAPQVFSRISTYADEIKLGTVRAVTLTTDSGPCAMFGAGQVFIAVVGKPGQTLPEATLLRVAAELTNLKS